jgi:hypothetical protein
MYLSNTRGAQIDPCFIEDRERDRDREGARKEELQSETDLTVCRKGETSATLGRLMWIEMGGRGVKRSRKHDCISESTTCSRRWLIITNWYGITEALRWVIGIQLPLEAAGTARCSSMQSFKTSRLRLPQEQLPHRQIHTISHVCSHDIQCILRRSCCNSPKAEEKI